MLEASYKSKYRHSRLEYSHVFLSFPFSSFPAVACLTSSWCSSSFLNTWPYHLSCLFLRLSLVQCWLLFRCLHSWCGRPWYCLLPISAFSSQKCVFFVYRFYCPTFRPVYHCRLHCGFVDIIFEFDRQLLIAHDSWYFYPFSPGHLHSVVHTSL